MPRTDALWISWQRHRRTDGLVRELGVPLRTLHSASSRWLKHPTFLLRTLGILLDARPRVLFVQNPSWFLTLEAILLKPLLRYTLVVDAHNGGVYPFFRWMERFRWVFPLMLRGADLTIVTNEDLAAVVRAQGGEPWVLPDALPDWEPAPAPRNAETLITFICTFADDEPVAEVVRAAAQLPPGHRVRITGKLAACPPEVRAAAAPNTEFTDFLSEADFHALLSGSDVIMDLTTFDDCLVCGAYEAVALGVPLILSDSPVNRAYFRRGVVYARNEAADLARAMVEAGERSAELRAEAAVLRTELQSGWRAGLEALRDRLDLA